MLNSRTRTTTFSALLAILGVSAPAAAQHAHPAHGAAGGGLQIPEPMRIEHEAIHSRLDAATRAEGPVGAAARALARVLGPHFERENQIALPPLGLLETLAHGAEIPPHQVTRALAMTDSLRAELPRMLEEHVHIDAAAKQLEEVARQHDNADVADLAHGLRMHARTEQAVHYPAALLVGTVLRHGRR
jgi:hypothetical protein